MFKALLTLLSLVLLAGCGVTKKTSNYSYVDSSWVTHKKISIPVPGGLTSSVNLDSVRDSWLKPGEPLSAIPSQIVNKVFYVKDTSGRAELRYWFDANGKMYAECSAKDQTITTLVAENNRLIKENKVTSKQVRRLPVWIYVALGVIILILFLLQISKIK